jgi:hypothetical protein
VKHQFVLEHLLETYPNNTGLQRAYNNSLRLEEMFGEKTMIGFNRTVEKNNQTIIRAIRLEQKDQNRTGWPDVTTQPAVNETQQQTEQEKNQNRKPTGTMQQQQGTAAQPTVTETQVQQTEEEKNRNKNPQSVTQVPVTSPQQTENQQGGNNGDKGKGSSRNK